MRVATQAWIDLTTQAWKELILVSCATCHSQLTK